MLELASLHLLYGRQFGLRDVVLVHVEQDILDHDDVPVLGTKKRITAVNRVRGYCGSWLRIYRYHGVGRP